MVTAARETVSWFWFLLSNVLLSGLFVLAVTDPAEIEALLAIKQSLIDNDGRLDSWKSGTDPCSDSWERVYCLRQDYPTSLATSNYSHVTELRLLSLNLGGTLTPEVGNLPALKFLDVMWNNITGSIPASIGKLENMFLLLLNGNNFTGVLPPEIGNLVNLNRIQIDQNNISGPVPDTFANLKEIQHLHMNNNSLNGSIPPGLGSLPNVVHILLDNNQLTGELPPELASAPKLLIIQLDNNQFNSSATIPAQYGQIPTLLKLSLRNCNLQGNIPNFSGTPKLGVLDLSHNNLNGPVPTAVFPANMTAIDLSYNQLIGSVPESIGNITYLEYLEMRNNPMSGTIPANLGAGYYFNQSAGDTIPILDFQNTSLVFAPNGSILVRLQGNGQTRLWMAGNMNYCNQSNAGTEYNPLCIPATVDAFLSEGTPIVPGSSSNSVCYSFRCKYPYASAPATAAQNCRCAAPITVRYRLKSPGFRLFDLYEEQFLAYISEGLVIAQDQVEIKDYTYEPGPRIAITLLLFPTTSNFNTSELNRLNDYFTNWDIFDSSVFGPYELIEYIGPGTPPNGSNRLSSGTKAGIIVAAIFLTTIVLAAALCLCLRKRNKDRKTAAIFMTRSRARGTMIKVAGVRTFSFEELVKATDNFSEGNILGRGGYGKVYYGVLEDGQKIAVKRAEEGSLQGATEFENEIQLLSRVHHRNLVSLVGYCNDDGEHLHGEQMLVYEFMPNGTLRDHLNKDAQCQLDFSTRLRIALGSARGLHYLHTQANPPIFHRDIKATNILLDDKYNAKVADFGLSKLAPTDVDFEGANAGHVSTVVKGTPGYLDPEYFLTHKLTDKSDVYSFGVVLLELITGMHPISQGKNIVREVNIAFAGGLMTQIVDVRMGSYPPEILEPLTRLALACCKSETDARPSMAEVLHGLEEIWKETPWSDFVSQSFVGDAGDPADYSGDMLPGNGGFPGEMNLYYRSDAGSNSDLISGTVISVQPR